MARKAIFITGGGSGIGRATAQYFAAQGWFVGIADVNKQGIDETAALLPDGASSRHVMDVRDRDQWKAALAEFAAASGGRLDVLFNNAGIGSGGQFLDMPPEEADRLIAINFGGVIAPFICAAWIGAHYGYRWGFVAAAAGMLLGTLVFEWRQRKLPGAGDKPRFHRRWSLPAVVIACLALIVPTGLLMAYPDVLHYTVYGLMGVLVLYFVVSSAHRGDRVQNHRYVALLLLFVALIAFWAMSLLSASALNFFARDHVAPLWNGSLLGMPWDFTLFQSVNPLCILVFAPFMALLWPWLDRHRINPVTPRKFGIGLLLVALGYGVLWFAIARLQLPDGKVAAWTLLVCYLCSTVGELALSPIGYALIGKLAAPDETSLAMGGWFFGVGVSYDLSGQIAAMTTAHGQTGIGGYEHVFAWLLIGGVAIALVYLITAPWIVKLMHGVH